MVSTTSNPIPNKLCSDHLFLLVGTNPLPDWVATQLLLLPGGQLYLICSKTTEPVAVRLAQFVRSKGLPQPEYLKVDSPFAAGPIRRIIQERLRGIQAGSIGFNYTGGTKAMATQGYRSFESDLPAGLPKPVLSYLESDESTMHFDPHPQHCPAGDKYEIPLSEAQLSLKEILELHGDFSGYQANRSVKGEAALMELLEIHLDENERWEWRRCCDGLLKQKPGGKFKYENELRRAPFDLPDFPQLSDALITNGSSGRHSLDDVWRHGKFPSATELAKWLDGQWLEHYVLQTLKQRQQEYGIQEFTRSLEPRQPFQFEVDVVAMRGYQLHVLSCYSGSDRDKAKLKLFEALTRARFLGGEAARAALVCFRDDPTLEQEIGELWVLKQQVKVFGRNELYQLGDHLRDWFKTGSQKV